MSLGLRVSITSLGGGIRDDALMFSQFDATVRAIWMSPSRFLYLMCHFDVPLPFWHSYHRLAPRKQLRSRCLPPDLRDRKVSSSWIRIVRGIEPAGGTAATRRGALQVLAGGMAASAFALLRPRARSGGGNHASKVLPIAHCKVTLAECHNDLICCSGHCKKNLTAEVKTPVVTPCRRLTWKGSAIAGARGAHLLHPAGRGLLLQRPLHQRAKCA